MESFLQDLRFGFRTLLKHPGVSAVAIIAIALGTGANSAIFSVVNAVLLRPLPYQNPDGIVLVWGKNATTSRDALSVPDYLDYRSQNSVFAEMAAFAYDDFNLNTGDEPEHVQGTMVSANYFSVLGATLSKGAAFGPEDDQPGAGRIAIISNGLWKRRFGSDPNLIGQPILLNGASFIVTGIAAANFQSPNPEDNPQVWVPLSLDGGDRLRVPASVSPASLTNRRSRFLIGIARLKPGVIVRQAQSDLDGMASRLEQQYKDTNAGIGASVVSLREHIVGKIQSALVVLLAAVGFVLLIACANVANLLLARAATRQKEIAIRTVMGAGRLRLIRQMLTESVLLAVVGSAFGLAFAYGEIKLLLSLNPANIPRLSDIEIDGRVLGFTFLIAILTGIIFGLAPALQASKTELNEALKEAARGSTGGINRQRVRSLLVVSEVALTVLLLIGAGLMLKSFYSLQRVNPGFNPASTLTMMINLPVSKYADDHQVQAFFEQALNRVSILPGVQAAGAVTGLPLTTTSVIRLRFIVDAHPPTSASEVPRANFRSISHDYFRAMGIPLVKGRYFTEQDRDKSPPVVIINETMANRYWQGEDPIGRRMTIPSLGGVSREIAGVVADVKHSGLDTESGAEMYVPYLQKPFNFMALVIRTTSEPLSLTGAVRSEIQAVDKSQPVYDVKTMQQVVGDSVSQPRLYTLLLGIFGALALTLAAVGIYGVMNYSVVQRRHEIGIRMALGAQRGDILKMVVGQGMLLALIGIATGLTAALILTRVMETLLFGVSARDLWTFVLIPFVLAAFAFVSSYIPARKATRVDPMIALRYE
ncbi:MAG TPA: ABC transporter permease [Blastocatellia bacterium]|nr:ABC transporter permease [Blastocatellia bacterium]